ncbi:MAG: hypothetical protein M3Y33_09200 [Actinomycetota bacterium]|nr:hypothetical protein [Actinomycetota bacterium]
MSANPRVVMQDTQVSWEGTTTFVRRGTIVDAAPGSQLEAAYGGPSNLRSLSPDAGGDPESASRAAESN